MILPLAVSLLAVAAFGLALWRTNIARQASIAVDRSTAGVGAMLDPQLDDDAKEKALRQAGFKLLASAWQLAWRFALTLAAAVAPILIADALGIASSEAVFALMLRVDYIVIVSVLAIAVVWAIGKLGPAKKPAAPVSENNHYSGPDRFFHYLAFAGPGMLKAASRLEDRMMPALAATPDRPPIFVTSLARAGTTALLNALSDIPSLATHTYRDMPFLTAPVLWDRMTGGSKRAVERRERAHGDGLEIALDSPEAFEEVLWKMFWPEKFAGQRIALWHGSSAAAGADAKPEAERFMAHHMAKIVGARGRERRGGAVLPERYCSKNNANIARLGYLLQAFPGCRIVIPVRRPESHAASLLRQHRNFSTIQAEDDFVRRYMRDIGHYEFGLIHKPIAFTGFETKRYERDSADYWLYYWICAFREILVTESDLLFVTQDDLRSDPQPTMQALCVAIGVDAGGTDFTGYFRSVPDQPPVDLFTPDLRAEALAVYGELCERAITRPLASLRTA